MRAKVASQAGLWYNKRENTVVPERSGNYLRRETHLTGGKSMDTLPPHAIVGNLIPDASGIYKITCKANKRIYIGSAVNLRRRKNGHWHTLRKNKHHSLHLQRAWNKYSEQAFTFEVLELVLPISLTAREQYWLNKLKPFGRKGFNGSREAGSPLGMKRSPEAREKMRLVQLGKKMPPMSPEAKAKISQANLGRKRTPEAKAKMRQVHLGKILGKHTPEHCENIRQSKLGHEVSLETREKIRQTLLGRKLSPEHIEKRRQAQLGSKRSPETRERMRQASLAARQRKRSNEHAQDS